MNHHLLSSRPLSAHEKCFLRTNILFFTRLGVGALKKVILPLFASLQRMSTYSVPEQTVVTWSNRFLFARIWFNAVRSLERKKLREGLFFHRQLKAGTREVDFFKSYDGTFSPMVVENAKRVFIFMTSPPPCETTERHAPLYFKLNLYFAEQKKKTKLHK